MTPSLPTTATTGCKRKSASTASSLAAMPDCRRKVCKRATGWITSASLQIPAVVNYTFGLMCAYLLLPNYPFPCPNKRLMQHQQQQTQQDELSMPNWCNIDGFSQIHEYLEGGSRFDGSPNVCAVRLCPPSIVDAWDPIMQN